ncbi:RipA family octameric membrane protein [Polyangium aurulentum]|uniref:RipA family octameric membrane protein n=1 Tax=Polyangium aurulentum TaxID=2567896 RepID=UPI00146E7FFD|nr:hypothetical protein [Polyangium aurulentum]UQA57839.1 hypothetical protein E8A73_042275 [Polyangium aurulentum]
MSAPTPAEVLVVAPPSQDARASRIVAEMQARELRATRWDGKGEEAGEDLASAAERAAAIVLFADRSLFGDRTGKGRAVAAALAGAADKLIVVVVEHCRLREVHLRRADTMPARGTLVELEASAQEELVERLVHELLAEVDASYEPERTRHFDEYRLLFDSTEQLVERRRAATATFLGVSAAIGGVISFLAKDLALSGLRLVVLTAPLFVTGLLACRLWQRTIRQYEALIDWRYRQLRRMERRRFVGSYRLFGKEWDAIYAPRARRSFGFSSLEAQVPRVLFLFFAAGLALVVAHGTGLARLR